MHRPILELLCVLTSLLAFIHRSNAEVQCNLENGECSTNLSATGDEAIDSTCGIWFAQSSIPHSGLGMYAGRDFRKDEDLMETGDLTIPIIDMILNQGSDLHFMWDSYTWEMTYPGAFDQVKQQSVASPGFGSAANSFLDLQNVEEMCSFYSGAGLARRSPGAGAITPHHYRRSTATMDIPAGQEFFVSYGSHWFLERTEDLGPVPILGDLPKANRLLSKWNQIRQKHNETNRTVFEDLWETFVWNSSFTATSRLFFSLPKNWEETMQVLEMGLVNLRKNQSMRSLEWLEEHGICGDNMRDGLSKIPHAGRGAFATRFLKQHSIVAPLPLIHIPHRKRLEMYETDIESGTVTNKTEVVGQQLIMNYCFGHRESTILLCPYGLFTGLINHANNPNVKLRWSDPKRSIHHPEWLNRTVDEFVNQKFAALTMELVALRDIEPDEEIVMDYGEEWEIAWKEHLATWSVPEGSESYVSALELNDDMESKLKTVFQQMVDPYPANVHIRFDPAFRERSEWIEHMERGTLVEYTSERHRHYLECDILRIIHDENNENERVFYTAAFLDEDEDEGTTEYVMVEGVPREAFQFVDNPYTVDYLQRNAFRHDMRIPDDIFPSAWKNVDFEPGM